MSVRKDIQQDNKRMMAAPDKVDDKFQAEYQDSVEEGKKQKADLEPLEKLKKNNTYFSITSSDVTVSNMVVIGAVLLGIILLKK